MQARHAVASVLCILAFSLIARAAEITVERTEGGAAVKVDGQLFTEYLTKSGTKPILWPIIGPTGATMTRAYPMAKPEGEKQDHPHHRSLWFTHGAVNGVDFWAEPKGVIEHLEFVSVTSKPMASIVARNAWLSPDGKKVCEDHRTLRFGATADARWIDFEITVKATDGPVTFGDTKEGSFGLRVAETMKVDAKKGGKIVNSEGDEDGAAWAKRAAWVDYHGPVDGKTVGVAIFDHPTSFRHPTYWHVRTYGLFAANPFGVHDFTKQNDGSHTITAEKPMTLRYRVYFHAGDEREGKVAEAYQAYSSVDK